MQNSKLKLNFFRTREPTFETPKGYSIRRRLKKINKYEDYDDAKHSSSSRKQEFDSTECTREQTELARIRYERRKQFMINLNTSCERVKQVQLEDESIDDIEDDEEWDSIPSEEKEKKNLHNDFYSKIKLASQHKSDSRDNPYWQLFDEDPCIHKIIDEILSGEQLKFSDNHESYWREEVKEEINYDADIHEEDNNQISIVPEFNLDKVSIEISKTPMKSYPKKDRNYKGFNKYQKSSIQKDNYTKESTPKTQVKKKVGSIKSIEPKSSVKRGSNIKVSVQKDNSKTRARNGTQQNKTRNSLDPISERLLNNFYYLIGDSNNKVKILEQFKVSGKGGVIEFKGEPIYPLKITLDYLLNAYQGCTFAITTSKWTDSNAKYRSPIRRAFKESKNIDNMAENKLNPKIIDIEGRVLLKCENQGEFKHQFEIKNNLISRLLISI